MPKKPEGENIPVFLTYSQRLKQQEQGGQPEVYRYDFIPRALRNQVLHALKEVWGTSAPEWDIIYERYAEALGLDEKDFGDIIMSLNPEMYERCAREFQDANFDGAIDFIDIAFREVYAIQNDKLQGGMYSDRRPKAKKAIEKLNYRFRQHSIGYQFEGGQIIKVDSQYIHAEVVKPTLSLLHDAGFQGAEDEFLRAHQHYREGNWKAAMDDASKALESTLKAICATRKWQVPPNATAVPLIDAVIKNGLLPPFLESQIGSLRSAMQNGLPSLSNKLSRHGQGKDVEEVFAHTVAYALHLAASNIVFLVESHNAMPKGGWPESSDS